MHVGTYAWFFQVYLFNSASRFSVVLFFQLLRVFNLVRKFTKVLFFSRQILLLYSSISTNGRNHLLHTSPGNCLCCLSSSLLPNRTNSSSMVSPYMSVRDMGGKQEKRDLTTSCRMGISWKDIGGSSNWWTSHRVSKSQRGWEARQGKSRVSPSSLRCHGGNLTFDSLHILWTPVQELKSQESMPTCQTEVSRAVLKRRTRPL